jgi:hypothetical protein
LNSWHLPGNPSANAPVASRFHSTFHRLIEQGIYSPDWADGDDVAVEYADWYAAQCPSVDTLLMLQV